MKVRLTCEATLSLLLLISFTWDVFCGEMPRSACDSLLVQWNILYDGGTFHLTKFALDEIVGPMWRLPCYPGAYNSYCTTGERLVLLMQVKGLDEDSAILATPEHDRLRVLFTLVSRPRDEISSAIGRLVITGPEIQALIVAASTFAVMQLALTYQVSKARLDAYLCAAQLVWGLLFLESVFRTGVLLLEAQTDASKMLCWAGAFAFAVQTRRFLRENAK